MVLFRPLVALAGCWWTGSRSGSRRGVWSKAYGQINEFERWLADDGQVLVKFWFHISKKEQRRRLKKMQADRAERWKVQKEDLQRNRRARAAGGRRWRRCWSAPIPRPARGRWWKRPTSGGRG